MLTEQWQYPINTNMSLSEIKEEVRHLSPSELQELSACIRRSQLKLDPDWLERAVAANARMDVTGGHSAEEFIALHERLCTEGR
jgi:hypothetical protein